MKDERLKMKNIFIAASVGIVFFINASQAFAHVVVRPSEVGVAAFQTFTVGVPVEKNIPTTSLRLVIPDGLQHVTPNVKPGWTIDVKKEGEGEEAKVTEIIWTEGLIPAGQRDEFMFSAQVPANETNVVWKAYQTYEDGSVVSWDQDPKVDHAHDDEASDAGPYSTTKVVNDLAKSAELDSEKKESNSVPTGLSIVAIAISAAALALQLRKKK